MASYDEEQNGTSEGPVAFVEVKVYDETGGGSVQSVSSPSLDPLEARQVRFGPHHGLGGRTSKDGGRNSQDSQHDFSPSSVGSLKPPFAGMRTKSEYRRDLIHDNQEHYEEKLMRRMYSDSPMGQARLTDFNNSDDPVFREAHAHYALHKLHTADDKGEFKSLGLLEDDTSVDTMNVLNWGDHQTPKTADEAWQYVQKEFKDTPTNFQVQARMGVERGRHFYGKMQREPESANYFFRSLFVWKGTILPSLMTSPLVYMFICLHLFFSLAWHFCWYGEKCKPGNEDIDDKLWPKISSESALGIGTFLVFFLTFYNGQVYNKLLKTFGHLAVIKGRLNDIAVLSVSLLGRESPYAWKMIRLTNCWFHFFMYGLEHAGRGIIKWRHMVYDLRILHAEEALVLKEMMVNWGALAPWRQCTIWMIETIKEFHHAGLVNDYEAKWWIQCVIEGRRQYGWLMDLDDFPIPCYYQHLMDVLVFVYTLFMSYGAIWVDDHGGGYTIIGYSIMIIGVWGLRETAVKMAFPFGDDDINLPWAEILCDLYIGHMSILRPGASRPLVSLDRIPPLMAKLSKHDIIAADTASTMKEARGRLALEVMEELNRQHNEVLDQRRHIIHENMLEKQHNAEGAASPMAYNLMRSDEHFKAP